ncbi:SPJ_0845 family protein [Streptococcus ictaluri]|uniref:ABC transporter, ATP-binding protein n=1 Tax=Streptococcus ictaluri 707-05 TaxID=764299 RepID=G5K242_9STRE|nr:SPJ_0845 family protein [Streptococcus ictaluri]EHI69985.1 ABC transporter, ATP-binding protein [Streptococcus ictaluri 707-05]
MAITHKKNDELEKMMAGFAAIPSFDKPLEVTGDGVIKADAAVKEEDKKD